MKVLAIGRQGQLATSRAERARLWPDVELLHVGRPEADLEVPGSAASAIASANPDVVVNCAAYTEVERAEHEPERAFRINAAAAGEIAWAAARFSAPVVHISTDYVFDGTSAPYREDAATNPLNVYGASKLAGEEDVRRENDRHAIVRTAWLFSPYGKNFVKTMIALGKAQDEVAVVADQRGSPSCAFDVADGLLAMLRSWQSDPARGLGETYHLAGTGSASWHELAAAVFAHNGHPVRVRPLSSGDWPTAVVRPADTRLDSSAFADRFGFEMPAWQISLTRVVRALRAE